MTEPADREQVLIFDFGAQYGQLIGRRLRDLNVFCRLVRHDLSAARVAELNPKGIILSGGPASVYEPNAPKCDPAIFDLGIPVLGICYGMQLACQALGGQVTPAPSREFGRADCRIDHTNTLFTGVPMETTVWMSHGDQVEAEGSQFLSLATTPTCLAAAVKHRDRPVYGLQFHPEVSH